MCALLAGLAVIMGRSGDMRKDDAFGGRVTLPFLRPRRRLSRARCPEALLPECGQTLVWAQDPRCAPSKCASHGYEGCLQAVLVFSSCAYR